MYKAKRSFTLHISWSGRPLWIANTLYENWARKVCLCSKTKTLGFIHKLAVVFGIICQTDYVKLEIEIVLVELF